MKKKLVVCLSIFLISLIAGANAWAVRSGGTFVFCAPYGGDVFSLDMQRTGNTQDYIVGLNIFRSLYKWDAALNKPVLSLATKEDVSKDGMVYTFKLRENVKFHNGRLMTADDIIYSYNRIMDPKTASAAASFIKNIKGAADVQAGKAKTISGLEKIDDFTLKITLEHAIDLGYQLYKIETAIVPKEEVEAKGDAFGTEPVGCGPFKFVKWVKGSEIVLEKFEGYFEPGKPYIDKLVYKIMPEGSARDMAFRAKELDANLVGSAQYEVYQRDPEISKNMIEVAEMFTRHIGFNQQYKPLADKRVRQAFNHALNSELIIQKLIKNKAFKATSFLPTSSPAFDADLAPYAYDVKKAKALMAEAGYKDGFDLEIIGTSNHSYGVRVVEAIIPFLKKIGIRVKPQQLEGGMLSQRLKKGDYQAYIWSLESGPDPLASMNRFHSTTLPTSGNYIAYNKPEFDAFIDKARLTKDPAERIELVKQADGFLHEDAPLWFFNYNKAIIAYQPWVHGVEAVAIEMMLQDFSNLWLDETSPRATVK
ncbi:MAG: ABC transporter substrate-binding protein [Desulfobacterales bacterium]|nr:ABC transporter substrate-binding protein [Desulfobacterales bacterium]